MANWLSSPRGQGRTLQQRMGGVSPDTAVYAFDITAAKAKIRGNQMCPSNWKNTHACPERNTVGALIQPNVMPGPWQHKERETHDPLNINEIAADYSIDATTGERTLLRRSGRYYTCEEWPPRR